MTNPLPASVLSKRFTTSAGAATSSEIGTSKKYLAQQMSGEPEWAL